MVDPSPVYLLKICQKVHDEVEFVHQMNMVKYLHEQHNLIQELHINYDWILDFLGMLLLRFVLSINKKKNYSTLENKQIFYIYNVWTISGIYQNLVKSMSFTFNIFLNICISFNLSFFFWFNFILIG